MSVLKQAPQELDTLQYATEAVIDIATDYLEEQSVAYLLLYPQG